MLLDNQYDIIYDYDRLDIEERMEDLRGNIGRGTCLYCGAENGMEYEGHICFMCSKCGKSVHKDKQYVEWFNEAGMPFAIMVSVIAGTGLGLFWPIVLCVLLWIRYH